MKSMNNYKEMNLRNGKANCFDELKVILFISIGQFNNKMIIRNLR